MKKFLILIALSFFYQNNNINAQATHMKFKGIEMNCNNIQFSQQLVKKGYKIVDTNKTFIELEGLFCNINMTFSVWNGDYTNRVWCVEGFAEELNSWEALWYYYDKIKRNLTDKYGNPKYDSCQFKSPYKNGGGNEIEAIKENYACIKSLFVTDNGRIELSIGFMCPRIEISYIDSANEILKEKARDINIQNDI